MVPRLLKEGLGRKYLQRGKFCNEVVDVLRFGAIIGFVCFQVVYVLAKLRIVLQ